MKRISFSLMALALAATTMFSSCSKDDDGDDSNDNGGILEQINTLSATVNDGKFSTSLAGFYQSAGSAEAGTSKLTDFFGSTEGSTTIAGTAKVGESSKQLAINIKGTKADTYELALGTDQAVANAVINLLSGGSVTDALKDAVKTEALIIYRSSDDTEGSTTYYFSTKATVTFDNSLAIYSTGSFTATMTNKANDTFQITDGKFQVFGKPQIGGSSKN